MAPAATAATPELRPDSEAARERKRPRDAEHEQQLRGDCDYGNAIRKHARTAVVAGNDNAGVEHEDGDAVAAPSVAATSSAMLNAPAQPSTPAASPAVRVAVIVPFRDNHAAQQRQAHLDQFVPHMTALLRKQHALSSFHIFVIEQSLDERKFNRGKLLNAGFDMARNDYDVFVFHDVDLLPGNDLGPYYARKPERGPFHIARVWDRYNGNPKYFGGIVAFTRKDFLKINGFPNNFWGWGGEDDELYCRVLKKKLTIESPPSGTITDLEAMGLEEKLAALRSTKWKCTVKRELLKEHNRTWKTNGIKSLHYDLVDAVALNDHCTKITVHLGANDHWSDARSSLERAPDGASAQDTAALASSASEQLPHSDTNDDESGPLRELGWLEWGRDASEAPQRL